MTSPSIFNTLNDLGSSKTRERNNALDELTSILKQSPDLIPSKTLAPTCETLIELLDSEYRKHSVLTLSNDANPAKLSLTENRLSLAAYVLRLFIEKTCSRFKVKTMKLLLAILPELMVQEGSKTLVEPISVHLTFALHALIRSKLFQLKMALHQWVSLVDSVCSCLIERFDLSVTDRNVSNLISILNTLLGIDCIGLSQVRETIYRTLFKYLRRSQKQNTNTRLVLCIINELLVKTHCSSILDALRLIRETWEHVIAINVSTNEPIQNELCYLDIFASELIVHKIPAMIGAEELLAECSGASLHNVCREYLISRLMGCKAHWLSVDNLQFSERLRYKGSFFELKDFQLKESASTQPWLRIQSVTKLSMSYFRLLETEFSEESLFKKHKCEPSLSSIIRNSQSVVSFLLNGIQSTDTDVQLICLQMAAFTAASEDLHTHDIIELKDAIEQKFESIQLIKWACVALIPLFSQQNLPQIEIESSLDRILKLCLPLIKQPEICPVACNLLSCVMKYSKCKVPDKATLSQISSVYELSEVNGPGLPCNEAFRFWKYVQNYGKQIDGLSRAFTSRRIVEWMDAKWQQIVPFQENQDEFYEFIAWLCNYDQTTGESKGMKPVETLDCSELWQDRFSIWMNQKEERWFILQVEPQEKSFRNYASQRVFNNLVVEEVKLNDILYRLLEVIEGENGLKPLTKFKWVCQVINLAECLSGDSCYMNYLLDFKRASSAVLHNLDISGGKEYALFFRSILSLEASIKFDLFFEEIPIERVLFGAKELISQGNENRRHSDILDFDEPFNRGVFDTQSVAEDISSNESAEPFASLSVRACLKVFQKRAQGSFQSIMGRLLDFFDGLKPEEFIACLDPVVKWIQGQSRQSIDTRQLQLFTETLCEYLLESDYNMSNVGAYFLSSFLESVSTVWLENSECPLNADCNDIFDWLVARFEDTSVSGTLSIKRLSRLLLHMLKTHDLSRGHVKGGKQRVFAVYSKSLKALSVTDVVSDIPSMMQYMAKVSSKNQQILFSEVCGLVDIPQQSIEMSALYALTMYKISTASHLNMSLSIRDSMQYTRFSHTRVYITSGLKRMTRNAGLNRTTQLFDIFKFDILSLWFDESCKQGLSLEDTWDIEIFDFTNPPQFFQLYAAEISALYFSRAQKPTVLDQIISATGRTEKQLLLKYYYLVLPLAYVAGGLNENVHSFFQSLTGKSLSTQKNRTLLYRWIIRFIDLGSNYETSTLIEKDIRSTESLKILYFSHPDIMRYQYPLHIPLGAGLELLYQLLQKGPLCKDEMNFVLLSVLSDLEKSSYCSEKLKCLREMKLALAINESTLTDCGFLPTLIPPLCQNLASPELYNETADVITFILVTCREQNFKIAEECIPLYSQIFLYKQKFDKEVSTSLRDSLSWLAESTGFLKRTLRYCNDALQGKTLGTEVYSNVELLNTEQYSDDRMVLLSLLFGHAQRPSQPLHIVEPSICSARNVLIHEIPSDLVTENFQLWMAYYLQVCNSRHDLKTLRLDPVSSSQKPYDQLFVNYGSLEYVCEKFQTIMNMPSNTISCTARLFCASLIGLILNDDSYNDMRVVFCNSGEYKRCKSNCWFVTDSEFWSINNETTLFPDMTTFVSDLYLSDDISYTDWLIGFDTALLQHLIPSIPNLKLFHPLCSISTAFAEEMLPVLFNLAVCLDHKTSITWTETLFSKIGDLADRFEAKQKVNSLLDVMNMLMSGRRLKEPYCTTCCSVLPLKSIYEAALKSDQVTSAYMIFEMLYMNDLSSLDHNGLRVIYENLGEVDLFAGLPAPQTLIEALHSATKIEPEARNTFLFNNAMVDAHFLNNGAPESINLLKTSECQGLYGIASRLSEALPPSDGTLCEYRWALQLGTWDLPVPRIIQSKEEAFYFTLNAVSSGIIQPSQILEDSMVAVVRNKSVFKDKLEWLETIAEITLLKQMTDDFRSTDGMVSFLRSSFALDRKALNTSDFSDYKSNIQVRFLLSRLLVEKYARPPSHGSVRICSAALLANNIQLALQEKCSQDALRNAIVFDHLFRQDDTMSVYGTLRSFVSATALWANGDNKTPVVMLKGLLSGQDQEFDDSPLGSFLAVSNDEIRALLVKWTSKSRLETASTIFEKYIKEFEITVKDHDVRADTFYTLANFLNAQVKKLKDSGQVEERQKRCERGTQESRALEAIHKKTNLSNNERKDARRHYNRVVLQLNSDREILNALLVQRVQFVWRSLHYFINTLVFTNKYDGDVLDKFCGLWFEHDSDHTINSLLKKEIGVIPSWKFLPWVNQIASKLSIEDIEFQKPLQLTMKRVLYKLPYDSLYSVLSMKLYENHSFTSDSIIPQKIKAVDKILSELQGYDSGSYHRTYVLPLKEFCVMSVELANFQVSTGQKSGKKIHLQNLKMGSYWLKLLPNLHLPLPTLKWRISTSSDGKAPRPYITSVEEMVDISVTGLSLPKIATFTISDGSQHKVLMKGSNDDLRQDAIMEQVFQQVNSILQREKQMRKLNLTINTYTVIPLGPRAGIIEFVTNSVSLHQILTSLHMNDDISFNEARIEMKKVQTKSNNERLLTYLKLTEEIKPQLRNFFFDSFPDSNRWFDAKKTYTKGIATTSIVGYILGLGDRHLNNILLDHHTGRPTHIDLGIAFDQGRLLPIPEMIPFRLTRDIVDGFGVTGVEGLFRRSCEHTYSVLRENYEKVMHVLNVLKWDPLYSWVMSPVKKHKHLLEEESQEYSSLSFDSDTSNSKLKGKEENQESYRALKSVEEKLIGNGLSVEATVQELIQQASDPQNLSLVYMGWSPFY